MQAVVSHLIYEEAREILSFVAMKGSSARRDAHRMLIVSAA